MAENCITLRSFITLLLLYGAQQKVGAVIIMSPDEVSCSAQIAGTSNLNGIWLSLLAEQKVGTVIIAAVDEVAWLRVIN